MNTPGDGCVIKDITNLPSHMKKRKANSEPRHLFVPATPTELHLQLDQVTQKNMKQARVIRVQRSQLFRRKKRLARLEKTLGGIAEMGKKRFTVSRVRVGKQTPRQMARKGDHRRLTTKAKVMMVKVRRAGLIAAGRVGKVLDAVTKDIATESFSESWGSESTVLRAEKMVGVIELIFLRESLTHAQAINYRWDLSPQGNKELLATFISATFLRADAPCEYNIDDAHFVNDDVITFTFALPTVQCASKEGLIVAERLDHVLSSVGLRKEDKHVTLNNHAGTAICTMDGGSENMPSAEAVFGEGKVVRVYCACHALNLVFSWACETLPGKPVPEKGKKSTSKSTKMNHTWISKTERLINLIRRYWQSFELHLRKEEQWHGSKHQHDLPKPPRGVRTRWLVILDCFRWLMPRLHHVKEVVCM
jgi:hypothetical protein